MFFFITLSYISMVSLTWYRTLFTFINISLTIMVHITDVVQNIVYLHNHFSYNQSINDMVSEETVAGNGILRRDRQSKQAKQGTLAQELLDYFKDKIQAVCRSTSVEFHLHNCHRLHTSLMYLSQSPLTM